MPQKNKEENIIVEEIKRHNAVLMEHMDKQVKTTAEQYGSLAKRMDSLCIDVKELKEDMAIVKPAVKKLGSELGTVKLELGTVKSELGTVKSELGTVKSELGMVKVAVMENSTKIKKLESGQDRIEKKLDTTLADHERRIEKLEHKIAV